MPNSLFISYSRQEAPFVDSLLDELEDRGFKVWLDYHSLVPARPWREQIFRGVAEAETTLVVVSKASMASNNVAPEWRRAVELKKRIILIIFEAAKLPPELAHYEWIDFRGSFKKGLAELLSQLETPVKEEHAPPQKGFKAPPVVWRAFWLSLLVGLISIPTWWTIYIPYILIPLPYRILKRNFNFFHVQSVVVMLPFILFLSAFFFATYDTLLNIFLGGFFISLLPILLLFLLLRSEDMQRWGEPIASRPKFANPYNPHIKNPKPTPFIIDFAAEDQRYADDIIAGLKKYGHPHVAQVQEAAAAFVLISKYKNTLAFNPEEHPVYPIILQDTQIDDQNIHRIQWIDFRRGLRHLDKLAQLLPEPTQMLSALGVTPMSHQTVLPPIIQALVYFLTLLAIFSVSIWLPLFLELGPEFLETSSAVQITCMVAPMVGIILAVILFARWGLIKRRGRMASFRNLVFSILLLGLVSFFLQGLIWWGIDEAAQITVFTGPMAENDVRGLVVLFGPFTYILGLIIIGCLAFWYWPDLRRWFPYKNKVTNSPARQG